MSRTILIVLDSVGVGELPDAEKYGDNGANTLGNTIRATGIRLPQMETMGLGHISQTNLPIPLNAIGLSGRLAEQSPGKDTTTGHWEIAGVRLHQAFPTYPDGFPETLMRRFEEAIGSKTLANYPASGTAIIQELGEKHLHTGYPIVYTSADSVFQIAAHEAVIPLERLYEICRIARSLLVDKHAVGRVIARPFVGNASDGFVRTANRRDYSLEPTGETILDVLQASGREVIGVGKIEDIFAGRGITQADHAAGNAACVSSTLNFLKKEFEGLLFVNLVDFDMIYGHRRDPVNYAKALLQFDSALIDIKKEMKSDDLLLITADHGCDPTFKGTDHTREYAPLLVWQKGMNKHKHVGDRATFSDIAATIAEFFGLPQCFGAKSFLHEVQELH